MFNKKISITILILALIFIVGAAKAGEVNLVGNGSFEEEWVDHEDPYTMIPSGWTADPQWHDEMDREDKIKTTGECAIRIKTSAVRWRYVLQSVVFDTKPGASYTFSYMVYVEKGGMGSGALDFIANKWIANSQTVIDEKTFKPGEWRRIETTFQAPAGCEKMKVIFYQGDVVEETSSIFYIDDVKVIEL